jgi:hypothetical protein
MTLYHILCKECLMACSYKPEKVVKHIAQLSFSLAIALTISACTTTGPAPSQVRTSPATINPATTLKLAPLRERLRTIDVVIDGIHGEFLFDTAGGVTMISPDFAQRIGCTPQARLVGFRMMGDRVDVQRCDGYSLEISGTKWTPHDIGVLDLSPYLAPGEVAPDGNLAFDAFDGRIVTLDVANNMLIVETADTLPARIANATELRARLSREVQGAALAVNIAVPTAHGIAWFELDSGNGGSVLVSKHLAEEFNLDPNVQGPQRLELDLATGVHISTDRAFTPDMIIDGNFGMPFLSRNIVTFDLANGRVWIKANPQ